MHEVTRFNSWLERTRKLQEDVFGYDYGAMSDAEVAKYLFWNTFAVYQELAELAYEFSWKPWAVDKPFLNRDRIVSEAVDILHFVGNMLTALEVTDDELNIAYETKAQINAKRAKSGTYSALKGGVGAGSD